MLTRLRWAYLHQGIYWLTWNGIRLAAAFSVFACVAACSHFMRSELPSRFTYPGIVRWISAAGLRSAGYAGQGVRVGVISEGTTNYSKLQRAGILPPSVVMFNEKKKAKSDEADWMLQVIHQIAPQAKLASCYYKRLGLVGCATLLIQTFHADVIVTDLVHRTTSFRYPPAARALDAIHKAHPNVLIFAADGNGAGNFYRGRWNPVPWTLNGEKVLAQDFGASTQQPSRPYNVIRIRKGSFDLRISGHIHVAKASSACPHLQVRLVLLDQHNRVIAGTKVRQRGRGCGKLYLRVVARKHPALDKNTVYRVALVAPLTLKRVNFQIRLHGSATINEKPIYGANFYGPEFFRWRYAASGTAGATVGPVGKTGVLSIAALNPYTAFRGRYERNNSAGAGPGCYLPSPGQHAGRGKLLCYRQPLLAAPDCTWVAYPAHNAQGYRYVPFIGASAASPAVGGAAALLLSAGVAARRIPLLLESTAVKQPHQRGWSPFYGYGEINVDAAARAAGVLSRLGRRGVAPMPVSYNGARARTTVTGKYVADTHEKAMNRLAESAEAGSLAAMWKLGVSLKDGKYYLKYDLWAALVWWQRAARRGYPAAFCSLGAAYANAGLLSSKTAQPPIPYRPRLALALLDTCTRLGGASNKTPEAIEKLRANLTAHEIASAETLAQHLAHDPRQYLPSLDYEYIPN